MKYLKQTDFNPNDPREKEVYNHGGLARCWGLGIEDIILGHGLLVEEWMEIYEFLNREKYIGQKYNRDEFGMFHHRQIEDVGTAALQFIGEKKELQKTAMLYKPGSGKEDKNFGYHMYCDFYIIAGTTWRNNAHFKFARNWTTIWDPQCPAVPFIKTISIQGFSIT